MRPVAISVSLLSDRSCLKIYVPLFLLVAFSPKVVTANYIWEPEHQITEADTSAIIDDISAGRVTGERFHFTIEHIGELTNFQNHYGELLTWESSDNWEDLWDDRVKFFEEDHPTWDDHVTVDRDGNVHLMFETFFYYPPARLPLGFKVRGASNWPQGTPIFVTDDSTDIGGMFPCGTTSPHMFIQERATGDTLHMTYQQDWQCVQDGDSLGGWMGYRRTPFDSEDLDDPDLWRWERITWVTERFRNQSYTKNPNGFVFVDAQDSVHFFGEEQICNESAPDSLRLLHLWGRPPAAGQDSGVVYWSNVQTDTLDYYPSTAECGQDPLISVDAAGSGEFSAVQDSNAIYLSWNRILNGSTKAREVAFTRINTGANGDPADSTIVLTAGDSLLVSGGSNLFRTSNGVFHLTYRGASSDSPANFDNYHMWTTGNPMVLANWSAPTKITVGRTKDALRSPHIFASNDSAWIVYSMEDAEDRPQVWGQMGHSLPDSVSTGETMTWDGYVYLDEDFTIPTTSKLIITAGSRIFSKAGAGVQIICKGQIEAIGTEGHEIVFSSFLGEGEEGEWDGITFAVEGCGCNGNGYSAGAEPLSRLENVVIENALYGVRIDDVQAPSLVNVAFEDITDDRHIYLTSDAFIPYGYFTTGGGYCDEPVSAGGGEWILIPGTNVVAASASSHDLGCIGEGGKVDLLVDGSLVAAGADGDSVYFRPEDPTPLNESDAGDDWGGIFFSYYSAPSSLEYASIGNAANPLYFYYTDDTVTVEHSTVKNFAETGIWAYGCVDAEGPVFDHVDVIRGALTNTTLGFAGVAIDQADGTDLTASHVDMAGHDDDIPAIGVQVSLNETLCHSQTGSYRSLLVEGNLIEGPGTGVLTYGDDDVGLDAYWTCGDSLRSVEILENTVDSWKKVGMLYSYPESVQVRCNKVVNVFNGIDVDRGPTQAGASIKFRENRLEALTSNSTYWAFRSDDALKTKLGPDDGAADKGKNELAVHVQNTKLVWERDGDNDVLDASYNYWFKYEGTPPAFVQLTASGGITGRFAPTGWDIDYSNFYTGAPSSNCDPPQGLHSQGQVAIFEDGLSTSAASSNAFEFFLGSPSPNPGREGISMSFAVPADRLGEYQLGAYDVTGRRVHTSNIQVDSPGRFTLEWRGFDDLGRALGTGVYFLKLDGPGGIRETRKVVLVR